MKAGGSIGRLCAFLMLPCVLGDSYYVCAEDDVIQDFLWVDSCAKLADKVGRWVQREKTW